MPWEWRGRRKYFYQPARVDGKPRRLYWGAGDVGRLHELLSAHDRRLRAKRVAATRAQASTVTALQRDMRAAVTWARQLVRACRLIGGEYQQKGQWRWRAGRRPPTPQGLTGAPPVRMTAAGRLSGRQLPSPFVPVIAMTPIPTAEPGTPEDLGRQLLELNERANRGDRSH